MELIKIYQGNLVDARELHTFLESRQDFSTWMRNRIKRFQFKEGEDYTSFHKIVERETGGSKRNDFALTLNMAKELAMVENNDKGREARRYFIEAEQTLTRLKQNKRLQSFLKLEATKGKLLKNIEAIGGAEQDFIQIDFEARKVFFNGEPLEDEELHIALIKARDFATEMTNLNFENFETLDEVGEDHKRNHQDVRDLLQENTGKLPESLKPEKNIKKLDE